MLCTDKKRAEFVAWAKRLDYEADHRPIWYAFYDEVSGETLTQRERKIIQHNLETYDLEFRASKKRCANPYCRYVLAPDEGFYVGDVGQCCWLCHDMDEALRQTKQQGVHYGTIFEWFDAAHKEWLKTEEARKKIKDNEPPPAGGFGGMMW